MGTPSIDRDKLLKTMKELVYVSTESGPVVPSKTKVIKTMTKQTPDPVSKPQDSEDWDKREYKQNKPLTYGKNLITTRDLYKKVFTEAVTNTAYRGMRMNLSSIDMKETHCKFIINRHDHDILVELFYPNDNENITVKLKSDTGLSNLYEVPLDSPQFINNFGFTILKTCDELIASNNTYDVSDDIDTMQYVNGLGNGTEGLSNSWMATDSSIYRESVDGNLGKLLNMCNAINLLEADGEEGVNDGQDPNAAAFNMPEGGEVDPNPVPDNIPGMNGGDVNGTDMTDDDDQIVNFKTHLIENISQLSNIDASGSEVNGGDSAIDTLGKMVSEKMAEMQKQKNSGIAMSGNEIFNGTVGVKDKKPTDIVNAFVEYYPQLDTDVKTSQMTEFINYLNNPGTDSLTLTEFNAKLENIFSDVYGSGAEGGDQFSTSNVSIPGEDTFGNDGAGVDMNEPLAPDVFGGGGDFMNDGSFGSMMDQVNPDVATPDEAMGGDEFGEEPSLGEQNGPPTQDVDKIDEVVGAMTGI